VFSPKRATGASPNPNIIGEVDVGRDPQAGFG
jgi:hypothetical protein